MAKERRKFVGTATPPVTMWAVFYPHDDPDGPLVTQRVLYFNQYTIEGNDGCINYIAPVVLQDHDAFEIPRFDYFSNYLGLTTTRHPDREEFAAEIERYLGEHSKKLRRVA